jgi:hypothetical protein
MVTVKDHLAMMAPALRATVQSARRAVKAAAPEARETACQSRPPRSKRPMWKIARYFVGETEFAAIGTFSTYAHLYFRRGVEIDDGSGLLEGGGKTFRAIRLSTPLDAARPEVKSIIVRAAQLARIPSL